MTNEKKQELVEEVTQIRSRLFDIANEFAGDETGHIAVRLHQSCGCMSDAIDALNDKENPQDDLASLFAKLGAATFNGRNFK